ncbi:MAG: EVE domain-containing protein [Acidobacteriia bacterium]|nr:EVE domain-containing protein [Terriglobia bacterium]
MAVRNYWLDLFTPVTWQEFLQSGGKVSGFRDSRWNTLQKVKPGDYFLCYVTGISRWIGLLEITSEPFRDTAPIWKDESFPCRVRVKAIAKLTPETGVPVKEMKDQLSVFQTAGGALSWTGHFRGSPTKWKTADGEAVVKAVLQAAESPVVRPIDPVKLKYRPKALKAKIGLVTVPESEGTDQPEQEVIKEPAAHTEIQWLLLKLGSDMGFSVWVARNDRSRSFGAHRFAEIPALKSSLPLQFDDATNRTIELIDVLWLDRNSIVAAFEIESTTSIYSGLLRMADLVAMQPNLNIPLFLVAPEERREKVFAEVNRPTFSRLDPRLAEICRYISFDALRERLGRVKDFVRYLKPDFLEELSEACDLEQES